MLIEEEKQQVPDLGSSDVADPPLSMGLENTKIQTRFCERGRKTMVILLFILSCSFAFMCMLRVTF